MNEVKIATESGFSDERLVSITQSGNSEYFEVLRKRYSSLIHRIAEKYKHICGIGDLIDAGDSALSKAIVTYSEEKEASFFTFAYLCIERAINTVANREMNYKKRLLPLDSVNDSDIADINDPESLVIQKEESDALINEIRSKLTPIEYKALIGFYSGKSYREISIETGKSIKSVGGALTRARAKIKR